MADGIREHGLLKGVLTKFMAAEKFTISNVIRIVTFGANVSFCFPSYIQRVLCYAVCARLFKLKPMLLCYYAVRGP